MDMMESLCGWCIGKIDIKDKWILQDTSLLLKQTKNANTHEILKSRTLMNTHSSVIQ